MDKHNISRDEIAEAMKNEFGFNRKQCLEIVNDIIDIIIEGLQIDKKVKIHNFGTFKMNNKILNRRSFFTDHLHHLVTVFVSFTFWLCK